MKINRAQDCNALESVGGAAVTAYTYDFSGRRTTINDGGAVAADLYNGFDLIAQSGPNSAEFLFGPGIDQPLAMAQGATISYYGVDGLGSVTQLAGATGTVTANNQFDAWGRIAAQSVAGANPFGYTGREFAVAGMDFYRARYYNPGVGRFLNEDPIRFLAGINVYSYTSSNPIYFLDPYGLLQCNRNPLEIKKSSFMGSLFGTNNDYFTLSEATVSTAISCYKRENLWYMAITVDVNLPYHCSSGKTCEVEKHHADIADPFVKKLAQYYSVLEKQGYEDDASCNLASLGIGKDIEKNLFSPESEFVRKPGINKIGKDYHEAQQYYESTHHSANGSYWCALPFVNCGSRQD